MNTKNVQVQMVNRTLLKINGLCKMLNVKSRSDVVKLSVDVAELVTKSMTDGGTVIIRDKDGNESKIVIPGLGYAYRKKSIMNYTRIYA